jgi:antitoxin component YwqK of YwqJK toxin-antitoxin module
MKMKKNILMFAAMATVVNVMAQRPELEARKATVYNCGDMEYDEGTDVVYYKSVPFTGTCKTYYENNSLEREANFNEGKEHGVSKSYYAVPKDTAKKVDGVVDGGNDGRRRLPGGSTDKPKEPEEIKGQLQSVTSFSMGVPEGLWEYYYANGNMAWKNNYIAGVKNGRWTWYYENGNPKKVESYLNNLKDGEYISRITKAKTVRFANQKFIIKPAGWTAVINCFTRTEN